MKRLAFLLLTLMLFGAVDQAMAQSSKNETRKELKKGRRVERKALRKLKGSEVSKISKASFKEDYGDVPNVIWTRSDYFDEANFIIDEQNMTAYYDYNGKLVGTTYEVNFEDIPLLGQQNIKRYYNGARIGKTIFFEDNEDIDTDMILYKVQFEDADNYFVELTKGKSRFIVIVDARGKTGFFKQL
ncbi:MAG: hypothetical protein Q8908_15520 [Bacteroidota bacterium]|nr:hypothetical protein [Bacteroidota bacterium]